MKKLLYLLLVTIVACAPLTMDSYYSFSSPEDDIITTQNLREFLNGNPSPKIVLRVDVEQENLTKNSAETDFYKGIEQQLLKRGFVVRDRSLFEKIISETGSELNYSEIAEKTDTELIIEVTDIDTSVKYSTNIFKDRNGKSWTSMYHVVEYGARVEFKVILISKNEFAGSYTFNYAPCQNGCTYRSSTGNPRPTKRPSYPDSREPIESVERNLMVDFLKTATNNLVDSMMQQTN